MNGTFQFRWDWTDELDGESVQTVGNLSVLLDGHAIWPVRGDEGASLDCFADELLSYLAECWQPLLLRQSLPLPIGVQRPTDLQREAHRRWAGRGAGEILAETEAVAAFADAHNMALSFGGQFDLPPLWFLRQGLRMVVDTDAWTYDIDLEDFVVAASRLGDALAHRLEGLEGGRWDRLVGSWRERDAGDPVRLQSLATDLPPELSRQLIEEELLGAVTSVREAANDNDEIRIAARMMGALPPMQIRKVLRAARDVPLVDSGPLEALSGKVQRLLSTLDGRRAPYEEGTAAAREARRLFDLGPDDMAEPFEALARLGVPVTMPKLGIAILDAISIWGPNHGPAVMLNAQSRRLADKQTRSLTGLPEARITAAHELCHLLLDRDRALGAVDILDGRMPLAVEQRARAFAAEFMLPAETALRLWRSSRHRPTAVGVTSILNELREAYNVTGIVARNQLEHGLAGSDMQVVFLLNQVMPRRPHN